MNVPHTTDIARNTPLKKATASSPLHTQLGSSLI